MSETAHNLILEFALNNVWTIAVLVLAIAAGGRALHGLNRLAGAHPRAAGAAVVLLALIGGGYVAAHRFRRATADPAERARAERAEAERQAAAAREEYDALSAEFDAMHHFGVTGEAPDSRKHFSYPHRGGRAVYHRRCRECDRNFRIKRRQDAILKRHPEWTPGMLPPPPLPPRPSGKPAQRTPGFIL